MSNEIEMNAGQEGTPAPLDNGSGIAALSPQSVLEPAAEAPSQPAAAPAEAPGPAAGQNRPAKPVRGPVRRFIRSVASHLVFAAIVTTAVVGYLYQREILNRVGDTLCTEDRLGGYMTKAARPSALLPSGGEQTAAPSVPVAAAPAITLSQPQPPAQSEPAPQPVLEQHASVSAPQPGAEPEPAAENVSTTAAPVTPAPVPPAPVQAAEPPALLLRRLPRPARRSARTRSYRNGRQRAKLIPRISRKLPIYIGSSLQSTRTMPACGANTGMCSMRWDARRKRQSNITKPLYSSSKALSLSLAPAWRRLSRAWIPRSAEYFGRRSLSLALIRQNSLGQSSEMDGGRLQQCAA